MVAIITKVAKRNVNRCPQCHRLVTELELEQNKVVLQGKTQENEYQKWHDHCYCKSLNEGVKI